ncbi:unnamed protein product [Prorocentrum cordatum]|uniref:Uncharacterized protein n=1 Tax=Prorocentrum cordatum TaxID=2364126 RepID=A0ABN9RS60_9DINO|nr:unnamed protein product [Polarella glacialis]
MQRRRAGELLLAGALVQSAGRAAAHKWHLIRHHNCFNHNGGYRVSDLVNPFEEPITLGVPEEVRGRGLVFGSDYDPQTFGARPATRGPVLAADGCEAKGMFLRYL